MTTEFILDAQGVTCEPPMFGSHTDISYLLRLAERAGALRLQGQRAPKSHLYRVEGGFSVEILKKPRGQISQSVGVQKLLCPHLSLYPAAP